MHTSQTLTWLEIKTMYPDQWVSLYDLEFDKNQQIQKAKVFTGAPELKSVTKASKGHDFKSHTFRFTGEEKGFLGFAKWELLDAKAG